MRIVDGYNKVLLKPATPRTLSRQPHTDEGGQMPENELCAICLTAPALARLKDAEHAEIERRQTSLHGWTQPNVKPQ